MDNATKDAIERFCSKSKNLYKVEMINDVVDMFLEGNTPKEVSNKVNLTISQVKSIRERLSMHYNVKFPRLDERGCIIKGSYYREEVAVNNPAPKKLQDYEKEFVNSVDINAIKDIVVKVTGDKEQSVRIGKIQKNLNVNYEVARQIYHRYKREVSDWWM